MAREISKLTGTKLVLHGTSSVGNDQVRNLFDDGIAKVNIWTILERNSSPVLFEDMVRNASKITGKDKTEAMVKSGFLVKKLTGQAKHLFHIIQLFTGRILFLMK